jgi:hypothetical protein
MSATKAQRIGIWIIAAFMAVGTIGSFAIIILANKNQQTDQARVTELTAKYQADVAAQAKELSGTYFDKFNQYSSRVRTFDAAGITDLKTEDLAVGDGETLTALHKVSCA